MSDAQGAMIGTVVVLGGDADWPVAAVLRAAGVPVLDAEPPPKQIDAGLARRYGFLAASVRAGALGDVRLAAQQVRSALEGLIPEHLVWTDGQGLPRDALRAGVEPGAESAAEVVENYRAHLAALKAAIGEADLVVLPLRAVALIEDGNGTVFPAPQGGMTPPAGCRTRAAPAGPEAMKAGLAALMAALQSVRPSCRVRLVCLGSGEELAGLQAMATLLAGATGGVLHHPLVDEIVSRLGAGNGDLRPGGLLVRLIGASDVVGALAEAVAAPAPAAAAEPGAERVQERAGKRARKAGRARRKAAAGDEARIICEDELLEAFS